MSLKYQRMNNLFHIPRIHKLRVLAKDRGATEAERATAALMAQRLMSKYKITQADIDADIPPAMQRMDFAAAFAGIWADASRYAIELQQLQRKFAQFAQFFSDERLDEELAQFRAAAKRARDRRERREQRAK